jgi:hypothetical protein
MTKRGYHKCKTMGKIQYRQIRSVGNSRGKYRQKRSGRSQNIDRSRERKMAFNFQEGQRNIVFDPKYRPPTSRSMRPMTPPSTSNRSGRPPLAFVYALPSPSIPTSSPLCPRRSPAVRTTWTCSTGCGSSA